MPSAKSRRSARQRSRESARTEPAPRQPGSPRRYWWIPAGLAFALLVVSAVGRVRENPILLQSFWGSGLALLAWQLWLFRRIDSEGPEHAFTITLRPQHYLQAALQLAVFAYWGWFWRPVYEFAWLLFGQLVFAYAFSMLLAWARRRPYVLGFGPFPIVLSTNLFLWFRDDWFYLQFLMIAAGYLGKEAVRWHREGRSVHIFNPSAFSLGLFSVVLIAAGASDLTWGQEIASTLTLAPRIYLFLFLVGLVAMYSFSITLIAGSAAAVLFGWSAIYGALTGVPYFVDSEIPAAVFLGLHLLVTDPSTSPRTPLGKAMFGVMYGVSVVVLFAGLDALGFPTFYDKLLAVPLLNLSVRRIDAAVGGLRARFPRGARSLVWTPARANLVHMGLWIALFAAMTGTGRTDGRHTGDSLPFWQQACAEGRRNACDRLVQLEYSYCSVGSGWACNELGRRLREGRSVDPDPDLALRYHARACELRFQPGCLNLLDPEALAEAPPRTNDLRLLVSEGGLNLSETPVAEVYSRACEHGWGFACTAGAGDS